MAAAGTMALAELVADKIPAFDSLWDSFQTFIRIPAGALLAAFAMGEVDPAWAVAAGLVGGTITAGTHFAKAAAGWPSIPRRSLSRTGWPRSRRRAWCSAACGSCWHRRRFSWLAGGVPDRCRLSDLSRGRAAASAVWA
jgi:hypothetical protein